MKKTKKKLVLAKETVRSLSQIDLGRVAGGTESSMNWSNPDFSCQDEFRPLTGLTCDC